ncbi:MAG: portal protein, partial [Acidobacteria bacterium]|nr:portal protein [Acidobacteriota bacterium]
MADDDQAESPVVKDAIACFKLVAIDAEHEQRDLEEDDLAFDGGEQWPEEVIQSRRSQIVDGVNIPARPMLTIPKLDQPVQLVINQMRKAHLGITVHADSEDASDDTAEVLQGLVRHIQTRSRADLARNWAFERCVKAGRGYYRVLTQYAHQGESGHWTDQVLVIKRILNQGSVYLDPYATEPDWSDGEWGLVGGFIPEKLYKERYPKSKLSGLLDDQFAVDNEQMSPEWMNTTEEGKRGIRVMEFFRVEKKSRTKVLYDDAGTDTEAYLDDLGGAEWLKENEDGVRAQREMETRTIKWYTLNGMEVLEEEEWPGRYIPIIPVIGREQYFRSERRWVGVIRPGKDGQRLFNYAASAAVEKEALDTKAPWVGVEGQFKGHEEAWGQSSTRNFPYLEFAPVSIGGVPAGRPERNVAGPNLSASLALMQSAEQFIKSSTFTYDPSLGDRGNDKSGRAILALQQQGDAGNSNYLDNLASVSMTYEAMVLLDLIPKIYDRPGRVQQILGIDDEPKKVILNAPFVEGRRGPQPAPAGMSLQGSPAGPAPPGPPVSGGPSPPGPGGPLAGPMPMPQGMPGGQPSRPKVKQFNLATGVYHTTVSIGKSYSSRVDAGVDEMGQVLQAAPQLLQIIGDIYFKFRDFPGHTEISERLKKMLPPPLQET